MGQDEKETLSLKPPEPQAQYDWRFDQQPEKRPRDDDVEWG
ncbi:MAG: hypothetical protein ACFFD3_13790 [Candidatus Thorarchaeota archaeon]